MTRLEMFVTGDKLPRLNLVALVVDRDDYFAEQAVCLGARMGGLGKPADVCVLPHHVRGRSHKGGTL